MVDQKFEGKALPVPIPFPGRDIFTTLFKECTPRILVVSDGLSFDGAEFGLSDFVNTLKATTIHGMTPIVKTAHTGSTAADITNFTFTSSSLNIKTYDVLFLFGIASAPALPAAEVDVIAQFMQAGGGVFATGDHAELGKALCNGIPRIRNMRYWSNPDVPSAGGIDRISTNLPGPDNVYSFGDQSDSIPQRIYPRYYPGATPADSKPHYLLQHPTKKIIEVFPDHPHEGECVVPTNLATTFTVNGASVPEWPNDTLGNQVVPELVALSMSAGGGFPGKQPLVPRSFGAIGAYDGHAAKVGRATVDATWHHFINVNLIASSAGPGLAADPDVLDRVHTYFRNTAEWLMPRKRRRCLRWPLLRKALELYPLREIIPIPPGDPFKDVRAAGELGQEVRTTLARFFTPAALAALEEDLVDVHDEKLAALLRPSAQQSFTQTMARSAVPIDFIQRAALGAATATIAQQLPLDGDLGKDLEKAGGTDGLEAAVQRTLATTFKQVSGVIRESKSHVDVVCGALDGK